MLKSFIRLMFALLLLPVGLFGVAFWSHFKKIVLS